MQEILGERLYTGEWLVRSSDGEASQFFRGVDLDNLVRAGIDMATRHVLDQHLVFTNVPRQHDLVVRGVAGIRAYAGLLDYLQSLEFIDSVMVLGLQADALTGILLEVLSQQGPRGLRDLERHPRRGGREPA